jgi:hypothetical protein
MPQPRLRRVREDDREQRQAALRYLPADTAPSDMDWLTFLIALPGLPPDSYRAPAREMDGLIATGLPAEAARILIWRRQQMLAIPDFFRAAQRYVAATRNGH